MKSNYCLGLLDDSAESLDDFRYHLDHPSLNRLASIPSDFSLLRSVTLDIPRIPDALS